MKWLGLFTALADMVSRIVQAATQKTPVLRDAPREDRQSDIERKMRERAEGKHDD